MTQIGKHRLDDFYFDGELLQNKGKWTPFGFYEYLQRRWYNSIIGNFEYQKVQLFVPAIFSYNEKDKKRS